MGVMKKVAFALILLVTLVFVCIVAYNILQTSNSRNLAESCGVTLTDDVNCFLYDEDGLHGKTKSFVNCNVLFERIDE